MTCFAFQVTPVALHQGKGRRAQHGTHLPTGRGDAMARGTRPGGKDFGGQDVGGEVGATVQQEEPVWKVVDVKVWDSWQILAFDKIQKDAGS